VVHDAAVSQSRRDVAWGLLVCRVGED